MANERVLIDDLELGEIDIYKDAIYEDKPFTGIAVDDDDGIHTEWTFVGSSRKAWE